MCAVMWPSQAAFNNQCWLGFFLYRVPGGMLGLYALDAVSQC